MTNKIKKAEIIASVEPKKKRRTVDDLLGINGLLILAIIGATIFRGGVINAFGTIGGLSGIYYLIKRKDTLNKNQKYIGWGLVVVWVILVGTISQQTN